MTTKSPHPHKSVLFDTTEHCFTFTSTPVQHAGAAPQNDGGNFNGSASGGEVENKAHDVEDKAQEVLPPEITPATLPQHSITQPQSLHPTSSVHHVDEALAPPFPQDSEEK